MARHPYCFACRARGDSGRATLVALHLRRRNHPRRLGPPQVPQALVRFLQLLQARRRRRFLQNRPRHRPLRHHRCHPNLRLLRPQARLGALARVAGLCSLLNARTKAPSLGQSTSFRQVAKEVRGNTEIGAHSISMAAAAVRLSERIFESVSDQKVLFIGAGEMITLCATHFAARKPKLVAVANRTLERGQELADELAEQGLQTESLRLSDLPTRLHDFDIIVSCTASTLPIIGLGMVENAIKTRKHRPMVMVDLAVPRDIEVEVSRLNDVYLYTVDDLGEIVQTGADSRKAAVGQAEAIIETRVSHFMHWLEGRGTVPLIQDLRQRGDDLRAFEVERAKKLLAKGEDPQAVLDALAQGLTNKFLHGSLHALQHAQGEEREALMKILPGLFRAHHSDK